MQAGTASLFYVFAPSLRTHTCVGTQQCCSLAFGISLFFHHYLWQQTRQCISPAVGYTIFIYIGCCCLFLLCCSLNFGAVKGLGQHIN